MKIESYKSEKWIEFKERYGLSKNIEPVDVANAFYAGYGEGYAKSSKDSYNESEKVSMILSLRQQTEKLQESNRIMREALEFISTLDNKELVGQEIKDLPKTISGITAREALEKVT